MTTRAKIDACKAAVQGAIDGYTNYRDVFNPKTTALYALRSEHAENAALQAKFDAIATAFNAAAPHINAAKAVWDGAVADDPITNPATPSPESTHATTVVTDDGVTWSLGGPHPASPGVFKTLRDGVWVSNGGATGYLKFNGVYAVQSGYYFKWGGAAWITPALTSDPSLPPPIVSGSLRANYTEAQLAAAAPGAIPGLVKYLRVHPNKAAMLAEGWSNIFDDFELGQKVNEFRQFPEYPGVDFVRVNSFGYVHPDPTDHTGYPGWGITSWIYHIPVQLNRACCTYIIKINKSVAKGFAELGLKLPGFGSRDFSTTGWGGFSARTGTTTPNGMTIAQCQATTDAQWDAMSVTYPARTYEYRPDTGDGYGQDVPVSAVIPEEQFVTVDFIMEMNTPVDPLNIQGVLSAWKADGKRELWIDDKQVRVDSNVVWRINPDAGIENAFHNIYHGGQSLPDDSNLSTPAIDPIDVWVGPTLITDGSVRGGMLRTVAQAPVGNAGRPSWLAGSKAFVPFKIPGTRYDAVSPATQMSYSGLAKHDDKARGISRLYGFAMGGHAINNRNAFDALELGASPGWSVYHPGSAAPENYYYYSDGLPGSAHTYFLSHVINAQNLAVRLMAMAPYPDWPPAGYAGPPQAVRAIAGFDLNAKQYLQWGAPLTDKGYVAGRYTLNVAACCKHPDTEDIYYQNFEDMWVRRAATGVWEDWGSQPTQWGYLGTVIDTKRNLRVSCPDVGGIALRTHDLTTRAYGQIAYTGDAIEINNGSAIALDEDNDLFFIGSASWNYVAGKLALPVWKIDPKTWTSKFMFVLPDPGSGPYGGRFDYFRTLQAIIYVPGDGSEAWCIPTVDDPRP